MKLTTLRHVLFLSLLLPLVAPLARAQGHRHQAPPPTKSVVRSYPPPPHGVEEPVPTAAQEPVRDGTDADGAAIWRPKAPIDPADVVLSNGEVRLERADLFLRGRAGMDFELRRRYRSRLDHDGPLGHGWDFTYGERLFVQPGGHVVRLDGRGHVDTWTRNGDGSFTAPPGWFGTLVENADGTFTLREPGGLKHDYDAGGSLTGLTDRNGNTLGFEYTGGRLSGVIDVFGRRIDFVYATAPDGATRLSIVRDFTGREVHYTYDAQGDLVEATLADGATERYTYYAGQANPDEDHDIHEVTFPNEVEVGGPPAMVFTYDGLDRAASWMLGGTNATGISAGGTATFTYEAMNEAEPAGQPGLARLRVTVVERNGNSFDVDVDELQHRIQRRRFTIGLRPGEPPFYLTRWQYDADGQTTLLIEPMGNGEVYTYDAVGPRAARRNLLERRIVGDAVTFTSPDEDIVWTYAYDPVYQTLVKVTDPRESSPTFVPPIGSSAPGRYTTCWILDYQEGTDPIPDVTRFGISLGAFPRGLGDVNGDGTTSQTAGNAALRHDPSVTLEAGSPLAVELGTTTQVIETRTWWNDRGQVTREFDPEDNETTYTYHPEDDPGGLGIGSGDPGVPDRGWLSERCVEPGGLALLESYSYDERGNLTSRLDRRRVEELYEYDPRDRLTRRVRGYSVGEAAAAGELLTGESAYQYETNYTYDRNGNRTRVERDNPASCTSTPAVGATLDSDYRHDILNEEVCQIEEFDGVTTADTWLGYDPSGNLARRAYPEGNEDRWTYDERHLVHHATQGYSSPVEETYAYDYDENGSLTTSPVAEGDTVIPVTQRAYTSQKRLVEESYPLGKRVQYTYDPAENRDSAVQYGHPWNDPAGTPVRVAERRTTYDELNRVCRVEEDWFVPSGTPTTGVVDTGDGVRTTQIQYDANGDVRYATDDTGSRWRYDWDAARRLERVTGPVGNTVEYVYDGNGNVIRRTETEHQPQGLAADEVYTTTTTYDQLDRPVRRIDSGGSTEYWFWDALDRLKESADANGPTIASDPLGIFPQPGQTGQMNDPGSRRRYRYDGLGDTTSLACDLHEDGQAGNPLDTNSFDPDGVSTNTYEFDRNRRQTAQTDDEGNQTRWVYDARDRITQVVLPTAAVIDMTYDLDGNMTDKSWPNGFAIQCVFDLLNRKTSETRTAAPTGLTAGTTVKIWGYDGMDQVAVSSATANSSSPPPPTITVDSSAVHDSLGHLREETLSGLTTTFTCDELGDVTMRTLADGRTVTTTYDALHRPMSLSCSENGNVVTDTYYMGGGDRVLMQEFGNGTARTNTFDDRREITSVVHTLPPMSGGAPFVANQWTRDRRGFMVSETRKVGQNRSFSVGSTGTLDGEVDPVNTYEFQREGNGILRREDLITMAGTFPLDYGVNALGAHVTADGSPQAHDALGNQLERTFFNFDYDQDQRLIYVENTVQGPLKELYYYPDGRLALTVQVLFGQVRFRYFTWDEDDVAQEWLDVGGSLVLIRTYYTFFGEVVFVDEEASPITSDLPTIVHQDPRSGVQARTFFRMSDYMFNGVWDFEHADYTAGGLELNTFSTLEAYLFKNLRFEPQFNAYTDDHGGIYFANTQRLGARKVWMPGTKGRQIELGNGYTPFASGNPVSSPDCATNPPDYPVHTFDRLSSDKANCEGVANRQGKEEVDNLQFIRILRRHYEEVDSPQAGDLAVFGEIPEPVEGQSNRDLADSVAGISHVALVAGNDGRGSVPTLGQGRFSGPVEFADARAHGTKIRYFRRIGGGLKPFERAKAEELVRQLRRLIAQGQDGTPVARALLELLQGPNTVSGPLGPRINDN